MNSSDMTSEQREHRIEMIDTEINLLRQVWQSPSTTGGKNLLLQRTVELTRERRELERATSTLDKPCLMTTTKLRRIAPGEYENDDWYVKREAEDDGSGDFNGGRAIHPFGYEYTPAPVYSWAVWNRHTGDFHDAYETLREARAFVERNDAR